MNRNLSYWQLDFTVESQANLAPDCVVMQEKSKSFRGPRQPPNPRPTLFLGLRPSAHSLRPCAAYGHPLLSDIFSKAWSRPCMTNHYKMHSVLYTKYHLI